MRAIDVKHLGRERVICCWEVEGLLIDPGPEVSLGNLLEALGETRPRAILLTHIHLDHAGATGALVQKFPDLPVYVHESGASHLTDPSKLLRSASRLYPDLAERFGSMQPVPQDNLRPLSGTESVEGFEVAYTPGHAWHHVSYLHKETGRAFVGDVAGVVIPPSSYVMMPTPPPDIDLQAWEASMSLVQSWDPTALAVTHFGSVEDVAPHLERARRSLASLAQLARTSDAPHFVDSLVAEVAQNSPDSETEATYLQANPPDTLYPGLERYWSKQKDTSAPA
jgi:glyoxylase-like metal-dependent hydrolase (beta-lactamase superfamily II)